MIRIVCLIGIAIAATAPSQLFAQSLVIGVAQTSAQTTPSFIDNRPLPKEQSDPGIAAHESTLRRQQEQIQRLVQGQNQAILNANNAKSELEQLRKQNAGLRARQEALTSERASMLESLRNLKGRGANKDKISDIRETLSKQLKNIKLLKTKQFELKSLIATRVKERDKARKDLANARQGVRKAQEANRFLKSELNKAKIKLLAAQKARDNKGQTALALKQSRKQLQAQLARQKNVNRKTSSELATARQTITVLTGKLKAKSPNAVTATTSPTVDAVSLARRRALAEALRRARAARKRTNQSGTATNAN